MCVTCRQRRTSGQLQRATDCNCFYGSTTKWHNMCSSFNSSLSLSLRHSLHACLFLNLSLSDSKTTVVAVIKCSLPSIDFTPRISCHSQMISYLWFPPSALLQAVIKKSKVTCKCHGVSGSCSLVTCWQQLSSFREVSSSFLLFYSF